MAALENKIDFAIAFEVNNANPNGDPLNGNRPRTTSEGLGEVSDVALKRKIRNRLQDAGESVFVQSDDRSDDGAKSLSDRFNTYLKTLPKDEQKQKNVVFGKVCERWLDVRSFGQVFAFKKAKDTDEVSIGVRGPVSIQPAFSINVVQYEGAPSFTDIINCACDTSDRSSKSYKRFAKDVKERLIECMFGGAQFPMSILNAACHKVTRPMGYDNIRVWRRDFEIACSLWKKHYIDETRKQHRQEDVITMYLCCFS